MAAILDYRSCDPRWFQSSTDLATDYVNVCFVFCVVFYVTGKKMDTIP